MTLVAKICTVVGRFLICNWAPDYSKFPPYMPIGRYMAEVKLIHFSAEVLQLQAYTSVTSAKGWKELLN
ncbi:hypothetical protein ILUMI_11711 [Ignelater luminosus]|uniref:Uncharacterized protein n=1 Tax=Ignelater luminosus TaxID=2038154 RepID=A0A8K0CVQ5_IGNLU|nr:hypothetical protein ILUMI_11711 [Ignelater luminosus]